MKEEMGVLTAHEVNKLMRKLSRERARVIREFVTRAYALEIGEEFFQCHLSALPELEEAAGDLNDDILHMADD